MRRCNEFLLMSGSWYLSNSELRMHGGDRLNNNPSSAIAKKMRGTVGREPSSVPNVASTTAIG
jgi:hypothetical protein